MRPPSARSLIFDLLSTLRRGSMPVAALVQAGALFGIAENAIRVNLSRLVADGRVERDERGRYKLGAAAAPVQTVVAGWREIEARTQRWDGGWIGVHATPGPARQKSTRGAALALRMFGFRPLEPALHVRPANLREGVAGVRKALHALGLPASAPVFALGELDAGHDARARALWDGAALTRGYRDARAALERSAARLASLPEAAAMTESFGLGGRVVQQLVLDPLLPEPLVDASERRALVDAMRAYDKQGRSAWADFLGRFDVPHRSAPADTRWAQSA